MNSVLEVFLNGELVLEYSRNPRLPGKQREFLDMMDSDMDAGIRLNGEFLPAPDKQQRCQYVTMELIRALQSNNQSMIMAACAYLVKRQPGLNKIRINDKGKETTMELVYDQVPVQE